MTLNPGTKLGPYEIVAPIGAGGMGEVYRAHDTRLGRDVAIKVLPVSMAKDQERLRRFEQEARTVAALNHPNVLGLHDIGSYEGAPFLVNELLEGENLRQRIESGPIPTRRTVEYALAIAHGLAAAHEKGIVHRDLKPENVFLTRDGRVKILDFGLAKLVRDEHTLDTAVTLTSPATMPGVVMGTVGYMSPEQVRGEPSDARSDIFSFGAVLYEMLTGKRAFKKDTSVETMTSVLKQDPPELSESGWQGPLALQKILSRCLEKNPDRRFQSASDLAFAIEALSGTGVSPTVAADAIKQKGYPWKWVAMVAGALACVAIGAGVAWILRPGPPPMPTFKRVSFDRGTAIRGRFASDGKTVLCSAVLHSGVPDTYVIREDYPVSVPAGLHGAVVLAVSKQDQMAVLVRPQYWGQYLWGGTLALVPVGGSEPRELLENAYDASWSPNGSDLAVIDRKDDKWQVEYPIGKVLFSGDGWLSDLRVSPDANHVAVFQHPPASKDDRGVVLLLDRDGKQKVISQEWEALEGMAWHPSGKEVWYSAAESGDQYCIRASTPEGRDRPVYCGTSGTRLHDIATSGRALVSTQEQNSTVAVIEHGSKEQRDFNTLSFTSGQKLTPDGTAVISTDLSERGGKDYAVYVQKMDGSAPVKIGEGGYGSDISDDGKSVLVVLPGASRIQVIPVGAGTPQALSFEGFQIGSANWFPDNQHILLFANPVTQPLGLYMTDRNGTPPKMLVRQFSGWADIMPNGQDLLMLVDRTFVRRSLKDGSETKLRTLQPGEVPVDWAAEPNHLFTQISSPTEVHIDKIDLTSDRRETWQVFEPRDQEGAQLIVEQVSITPDGRWMVITYLHQFGEFYSSSTLR
jgi:eukaryotic-like serine/threonine-protein kinase